MARILSCMSIVLIFMTAPIMGVCLFEEYYTSLANHFLFDKWKSYFKFADVNHDGKLSMEDVQECVNKFSEINHLDADTGKMIKEVFEKYWDECIFRGRKGDILEQDYVDSLNNEFNADKKKFKNEVYICCEKGKAGADFNGDEFITKDELLSAMAAWGYKNISNDKEYFAAYNPRNGSVPFRGVVHDWVEFITSTVEVEFNIDMLLIFIGNRLN